MDDQQDALRKAVREVLREQAAAAPDPEAFLSHVAEDLTNVLPILRTIGSDAVNDMTVRARLAAAISDVAPYLRREFRRSR